MNKNRYDKYRFLFIKYFLITVFLISVVSKFVYPKPFYAYVTSVVYRVFNKYDPYKIPKTLFVLIIGLELFLLYSIERDRFKISIFAFLPFLFFSVFSLVFNFPVDCGCFGEIITYPNHIYQISLNSIIFAFFLYLNKNK